MNEQELRSLVEHMVLGLAGQPNAAAPAKTAPASTAAAAGDCLNDIMEVDLRRQHLAKDPRGGPAFLDLGLRTPAWLGLGRTGTRHKTMPMLRMRVGHAAAQGSVFSRVGDVSVERNGFALIQTPCQNRDKYLTYPDRDRHFDEANRAIIKRALGQNLKVVLAMGDGLSSAAIEANAMSCIQAAQAGLKTYGLESDPVLSIKYYQVGASDHIGELTSAETVYPLMGERPDLAMAESVPAYLTYKPHIGISESKRMVISNVHHQGTTAVETGAYTVELIKTVLEKKASGIDLR